MEWYIFALSCAILAAIAAIIEKRALRKVHAMEFSAALAIFNLFFSLSFLPKVNFNQPPTTYFLLYICSFIGAIAFLFVAKALRHAQISLTSPFLAFGPVITAVLAFLVLGEKISMFEIIGIVFVVLGSYILQLDFRNSNVKNSIISLYKEKTTQYIFFALFLYALTSLIDRFFLNVDNPFHLNPETYLFLAHLFIAINFFLMSSMLYGGIKDIKNCIKTRWKWIAMIAVLTTSYRLLQSYAVSIANVALVASIKRTSIFFTTVIGGALFHEKGIIKKSIACVVMLFGALLLIIF